MITTGVRLIPINVSGGSAVRFVIVVIVLASMLLGCSAGRGDWDYELTGGYSIARMNGHCILLIRPSGSAVFSKLYITDFCMNDQYIGVCGISFLGQAATDEELEGDERKYYLVEVSSGTIYGSYDSLDSFIAQCETVSTGDLGEWYSTKEMDYYM